MHGEGMSAGLLHNKPDFVPLVVHLIYRLDVGGLENGLVNLINHIPGERFRHAIICLTDYSDFRYRIKRQDVPVFALVIVQPAGAVQVYEDAPGIHRIS